MNFQSIETGFRFSNMGPYGDAAVRAEFPAARDEGQFIVIDVAADAKDAVKATIRALFERLHVEMGERLQAKAKAEKAAAKADKARAAAISAARGYAIGDEVEHFNTVYMYVGDGMWECDGGVVALGLPKAPRKAPRKPITDLSSPLAIKLKACAKLADKPATSRQIAFIDKLFSLPGGYNSLGWAADQPLSISDASQIIDRARR